MTYRHSNAIREMEAGRFDSSTQRYIMIELAHMADNSGQLKESQIDIANRALLSRVTVVNEMKKLEEKKLIIKEGYGKYRVNILLERQSFLKAEPAEASELDTEKHKFELWCSKHSEELEQGTFILVSDEDTSHEADDYAEQGLISKIADEAILYKDGFYHIYERIE